jgi:hypothetical protein
MLPMLSANCTGDRLTATQGARIAAANLPLTLVISSALSSFANVRK